MPRIVLKPKYKALAKKNVVVDVKAGRNMVMKKKYRKPKLNMKRLSYQVSKMICEKKEYGAYSSGLTLGQISVSAAGATAQSGHYLTSFMTPNPANGNTDVTRNGDEVTVTGMHNVLQFSHQANTSQGIRGRIYIFTPKYGVSGSSVSASQFLNPNPVIYGANNSLVSVYDTTCSRNIDSIKNFKVLRTINFYFPADIASLSQKLVKTVDCSLKFKKPWVMRWDSWGNLTFGQIFMLVVLESGNSTVNTPNTAAVAGIPIIDTYSGLNLNWYSKAYYIDP